MKYLNPELPFDLNETGAPDKFRDYLKELSGGKEVWFSMDFSTGVLEILFEDEIPIMTEEVKTYLEATKEKEVIESAKVGDIAELVATASARIDAKKTVEVMKVV